MTSAKPQKTEPQQFPPLSILRMLWKRKISIGVLWLVLSAVAVVVIQRLPAVYSAETLILVDSQKIPEKYVSSTVSGEVEDRLATIRQQILSSTRLKKIITDLDLYRKERKTHVEEEILEMMRKDITVTLERGSSGARPNAFRIGYQGNDPTMVAQVANRVASLYIDENLKTREVQAEGTAEFIDTQLQEAKKSLDQLEAAVGKYKLEHNGELPGQESALIAMLNRRQVEMEANRDAINRVQATKVMLQNALSMEESAASSAALLRAAEAAVNTPQGEPSRVPGITTPVPPKPTEALDGQLKALRARGYSDDHPDVKRVLGDLARLKAIEAETRSEAPPAPPSQDVPQPGKSPDTKKAPSVLSARDAVEMAKARDRVANLKAQLELADQEIAHRKTEQQAITKDMAQYQGRLERLPIREQEMASVTRDYEITKANYKSLLDKRISAGMATDLEHRQKAERFTILDPARTPEKPFKPNRPLFSGISVAVALLIGLAVGFGREMKQAVFLGEWELPEDVPVMGRLPFIDMAAPQSKGKDEGGFPKKKWKRVAAISSAVSLIMLAAVGLYFVSR